MHSRWIQLLHIESRLDHSLRAGGRSENMKGQSVKGLLMQGVLSICFELTLKYESALERVKGVMKTMIFLP